jgi:phosphatidylserine decarboxylase
MAREGLPFLGTFLLLALLFWLASQHFLAALVYPAGLCGFLSLFMLFFFRDPSRTSPEGDGLVVAAADGKVVGIGEVDDEECGEYLGGAGIQISTFLSVFDVHVNRVPFAGTVDHMRWQRGRFRAAFVAAASNENERSIIGIRNGETCVIVKQIAGILARRIVCRLQPDDAVHLGDRFGLIRFGSRVDLIVPDYTDLRVQLGDRVRAGETVIGVIEKNV